MADAAMSLCGDNAMTRATSPHTVLQSAAAQPHAPPRAARSSPPRQCVDRHARCHECPIPVGALLSEMALRAPAIPEPCRSTRPRCRPHRCPGSAPSILASWPRPYSIDEMSSLITARARSSSAPTSLSPPAVARAAQCDLSRDHVSCRSPGTRAASPAGVERRGSLSLLPGQGEAVKLCRE